MPEAMTSHSDVSDVCSNCGMVRDHFCFTCGRIQPVPPATDFFSFLGLPRKLRINEAELEKIFYELSRQLHPDYFMSASQVEQRASIERSSLLNDAYRTLRDPISRTRYLLSLEGYREAEKKAPPDLLEEVFELNMQIEGLKAARKMADEEEEAEARQSLEETLVSLRGRVKEIDARLAALFGEWDAALDGGTAEGRKILLDHMSDLLSHRSYIRNLVRDIEEEF